MAFAPGQFITAQRLNRLQPKVYRAKCNLAISGAQTNADVPGATITFSTEAANALVVAHWTVDGRATAQSSNQVACKAVLDSTDSDAFALFAGANSTGATTEKGTVAQTMDFTATSSGSHTIKLVTTQGASTQINIYTAITITVYEVV